MRSLFPLFISLVLLSCGEQKSTNKEPKPTITGNWEGFEIYHKNAKDSLVLKGYTLGDIVIEQDSIKLINYPTQQLSKFSYALNDDSIYFHREKKPQTYKWEVNDSLLFLEQYERDSVFVRTTYRKRIFEPIILKELNQFGINLSILQKLQWKFEYEATKNIGWPSIDTIIYSPPSEINFYANETLLKDSLIFTKTDSFKYIRFHYLGFMDEDEEYLLQLEKIVNNETVMLSYKAIETTEEETSLSTTPIGRFINILGSNYRYNPWWKVHSLKQTSYAHHDQLAFFLKQENIKQPTSIKLYYYAYENESDLKNALVNWFNCFGKNCLKIEENKSLNTINEKPTIVLIYDTFIVQAEYTYQEDKSNAAFVEKNLIQSFGSNYTNRFSINRYGELYWGE